ncbi:MAG: hypothetical protein ACTSXQ_04835 [Alphaproteobacteria bacterium]
MCIFFKNMDFMWLQAAGWAVYLVARGGFIVRCAPLHLRAVALVVNSGSIHQSP